MKTDIAGVLAALTLDLRGLVEDLAADPLETTEAQVVAYLAAVDLAAVARRFRDMTEEALVVGRSRGHMIEAAGAVLQVQRGVSHVGIRKDELAADVRTLVVFDRDGSERTGSHVWAILNDAETGLQPFHKDVRKAQLRAVGVDLDEYGTRTETATIQVLSKPKGHT